MMASGMSDRADVPGGRSRRVAIALVAAVVLGSVLVACTGEEEAGDRLKTIVLDDFESGTIAGWQAVGSGSGGWFAYSDGQVAPDPTQSDPNAPFFVPDPPQGGFAAVTDGIGSGTRILYRDVSLKGRFTLHLSVFHVGRARFSTPNTLAYEWPEPNQQFRIDLIDPSAPIDSVAKGDVLVNVFRTSPGDDPTSLEPTVVSRDLSAWAGQTVRLRLVETHNQGLLRAGVDNIRFETIGVGADARVELLDTPEPTSALHLVLHRLTEAEALAALDSFLREETAADQFSGAVLVAKDGEVLFSDAHGLADREQQIPNTVQTRFNIGSMNKMFTAVAILQLVEAGKVELTAPLGTYLTDYPNRVVAERVTIHHLLTHTGGTGDSFGPGFLDHREELRTVEDYVELYGERSPEFDPGSKWKYSNYGFVLLGAVIEAVTGQSYYDYMDEHIYEPAGMTRTGSLPELKEVPDLAVGYAELGGDWEPSTDTLPYRGTPAGLGYSTVEDFKRFAEALLNDELLSRKSTELLITGKEEIGPGISYAYGFFEDRGAEGNGWVGHDGAWPGVNGDLRIYPGSGYVVVVLANLDPPVASGVADYLDARLPIVG